MFFVSSEYVVVAAFICSFCQSALFACDPEPGAVTNGDSALRARADAESLLEQEEDEFVTSISTIIEVEVCYWIYTEFQLLTNCFL